MNDNQPVSGQAEIVSHGDAPPTDDQLSSGRDERGEFSDIASERELGLIAEFGDFLIHNKKWWLTPIILVLLLMGLLVMLSGTAAAPFIYTLW